MQEINFPIAVVIDCVTALRTTTACAAVSALAGCALLPDATLSIAFTGLACFDSTVSTGSTSGNASAARTILSRTTLRRVLTLLTWSDCAVTADIYRVLTFTTATFLAGSALCIALALLTGLQNTISTDSLPLKAPATHADISCTAFRGLFALFRCAGDAIAASIRRRCTLTAKAGAPGDRTIIGAFACLGTIHDPIAAEFVIFREEALAGVAYIVSTSTICRYFTSFRATDKSIATHIARHALASKARVSAALGGIFAAFGGTDDIVSAHVICRTLRRAAQVVDFQLVRSGVEDDCTSCVCHRIKNTRSLSNDAAIDDDPCVVPRTEVECVVAELCDSDISLPLRTEEIGIEGDVLGGTGERLLLDFQSRSFRSVRLKSCAVLRLENLESAWIVCREESDAFRTHKLLMSSRVIDREQVGIRSVLYIPEQRACFDCACI